MDPNDREMAAMAFRVARLHGHHLIACLLVAALAQAVVAAPPVKRARPPRFPKSIEDAFFPDAREKLSGPRPSRAGATPSPSATPAAAPLDAQAAGKSWSKLIAAEVIEDEIKAQQRKLSASVDSSTAFKGGGFRDARASLALLAALLAIDAQFDGTIRWHQEAAPMRDAASRASANCKVGTDASYREARKVADELENLVRGGTIEPPAAAQETTWDKIAERSLLMKRLEQAQQQALTPWTANAAEFSRHSDQLVHEAQLIAALAEVIQDPSYPLADDETYREYARSMQTGALAVGEAVDGNHHESARQSVGELTKACAACHEGYRN